MSKRLHAPLFVVALSAVLAIGCQRRPPPSGGETTEADPSDPSGDTAQVCAAPTE